MEEVYRKSTLAEFPAGRRHAHRELHPVERLQEEGYLDREAQRIKDYKALFGTAAAMNHMFVAEALSRPGRLLDRDSSRLCLELHTNKLGHIDYNDYMGRDAPTEKFLPFSLTH